MEYNTYSYEEPIYGSYFSMGEIKVDKETYTNCENIKDNNNSIVTIKPNRLRLKMWEKLIMCKIKILTVNTVDK